MTKESNPSILDAHLHGGDFHLSPPNFRLFLNTASPTEWEELRKRAAISSQIFPFFGLHPWYIDRAEEDWPSRLEELLKESRGGIGEIGLDRFKEREGSAFALERQLPVFETQLKLSLKLERPVSIHCVRSWDILLKSLKGLPLKGVIHGFNSSPEVAEELLEMGFYLSFSPALHRGGKRLKELFRRMPEERILMETDSQEGVNERVLLDHYRAAAELREIDNKTFIRMIYRNGQIFTDGKAAGQ